MTEHEDRVRRALGGLPGPRPEAGERARRVALGAVPAPRRRPRVLVAAALAAAAMVALAGVGLGASGHLDVRVGPAEEESVSEGAAPAAADLRLPEGARGLAAVVGGRLWLRTHDGLGVSGLAGTAAELSPNASYLAAGIGTALVAMSPDGRRAWSHEAGGPVVAAAWAPNPILIAYVVRRGERHELRLIEGDGDGDRLLDADVDPVRPAWGPRALTLAYVGGDGAVRVRDRRRGGTRVEHRPERGRVTDLARAPGGAALAAAVGGGRPAVVVLGEDGRSRELPLGPDRASAGIAWIGPEDLVVADRPAGTGSGGALERVVRLRPALDGQTAPAVGLLPGLSGLAATPGGPIVAAVANAGGGHRLWRIESPEDPGVTPLRPAGTGGAGADPLLGVPAGSGGSIELSLR